MPYDIRIKRTDSSKEYEVFNTETGDVKGTHKTREKAERQLRLLQAVEYTDWRPTGKAART